MKNHRLGQRLGSACIAAFLTMLFSNIASAGPVTFSGTATSFTPDVGYGTESGEVIPVGSPIGTPGNPLPGGQNGTLLDVLFSASGSSVTFTLPGAGSSANGVFGSVTLRERFIDAAEQDGLGVTANITIAMPMAGMLHVMALGTAVTATTGAVPDQLGGVLDEPAGTVDLTIHWTPLDVSFGDGGLFRIEFDDLNFTGPAGRLNVLDFQTLDQTATITLLAEPAAVPEPTTLALLGLSLAGVGFSRRKHFLK